MQRKINVRIHTAVPFATALADFLDPCGPTDLDPNPISSDEKRRRAVALRGLLAALDREVVHLAGLDQGEADLLNPVTQEVDR